MEFPFQAYHALFWTWGGRRKRCAERNEEGRRGEVVPLRFCSHKRFHLHLNLVRKENPETSHGLIIQFIASADKSKAFSWFSFHGIADLEQTSFPFGFFRLFFSSSPQQSVSDFSFIFFFLGPFEGWRIFFRFNNNFIGSRLPTFHSSLNEEQN